MVIDIFVGHRLLSAELPGGTERSKNSYMIKKERREALQNSMMQLSKQTMESWPMLHWYLEEEGRTKKKTKIWILGSF